MLCTVPRMLQIKHVDLYFQTPTLRHDLVVLGCKEIPSFRDSLNSYTPESATQVGVEYAYG